MPNSTASQIISDAEAITKIDTSTIGLAGLEQAMILRVIDKANREYYNKFRLNGGEPHTDRTAETGGTILAATALNGAVATTDVTVTVVSTTSAATSGAGIIWENNDPDVIEYTGISSLTLTGVTGIGYAHADGDQFTYLYALPSNFDSFRSSSDSPNGVMVNGIPYIYTSGIPYTNTFGVYDNGTTKYLIFTRGMTGDYSVRYNKGATTISATGTTIDVPVDDENFVTYRLVEHIERVLAINPNNVVEAKQIANQVLLDALKRRNIGKKIQSGRPFNVGSYRNRYPLSETINQIIY